MGKLSGHRLVLLPQKALLGVQLTDAQFDELHCLFKLLNGTAAERVTRYCCEVALNTNL